MPRRASAYSGATSMRPGPPSGATSEGVGKGVLATATWTRLKGLTRRESAGPLRSSTPLRAESAQPAVKVRAVLSELLRRSGDVPATRLERRLDHLELIALRR